MTKQTTDRLESTWVAIDIAKKSNMVLIEYPDGQKQGFRMANTSRDYARFIALLQTLPGRVQIGLEPTDDYHRPLAYRLLTAGWDVVSLSSLAVARYREAAHGTWDKNDPKDAAIMLEMMKQGLVQIYFDALYAGCQDWRELSNQYFQLTLARTRAQHALVTHFLPLYFPELERYWDSTRAAWFLRFPTPQHITVLSQEQFIQEAWELVGRKVNKRGKLEELYELAQASIGLPVAPASPAVEVLRLHVVYLQELNAKRAAVEAQAEHLLGSHPDYQRLQTVPGIGPILALTILAEAGDLRRFGHHRQFLKYCGLNLVKVQSGMYRGRERLSKRGNARLRKALWLAAVSAVRSRENSFRVKYARYLRHAGQSPDAKRKALSAVTAKLARVVYALIKHGRPYRQFFEEELPSGSIPLCGTIEASLTS